MSTDPKMAAMKAGESVVVSAQWLDQCAQDHPNDFERVIAALNAQQVGTKDTYVAWLAEYHPPKGLEYFTGANGYPLCRAVATA